MKYKRNLMLICMLCPNKFDSVFIRTMLERHGWKGSEERFRELLLLKGGLLHNII